MLNPNETTSLACFQHSMSIHLPTIAELMAYCQASAAGGNATYDPSDREYYWQPTIIASSDLKPFWVSFVARGNHR